MPRAPDTPPVAVVDDDAPVRFPGWRPLATLLAVAGTSHFLVPRPYERIVPSALGDPRPWVVGSGLAELACGLGLVMPATRRQAALASAVLFALVYPANVQMAYDARRGPAWLRAVAYGRLPLQVPLVLWALQVAGDTDRSGADGHRAVAVALPRADAVSPAATGSSVRRGPR